MDVTTITLPVSPHLFWGTLTLVCIALASGIVYAILPTDRKSVAFVEIARARLGARNIPVVVFVAAALLWVALAVILVAGLFGLILDVITQGAPTRQDTTEVWDFRFRLVQLTALTTVLGAVIALPITMSRLRLTQEQTGTAKAALFNDKINAATEGLYARRQVSMPDKGGKHEHLWQDDIVQRSASIFRLEKLADENSAQAGLIAGILSNYLRSSSNRN